MTGYQNDPRVFTLINAVWNNGKPRKLDDAQMATLLGLKWEDLNNSDNNPYLQRAAKDLICRLITVAVPIFNNTYPGYAMIRPGDGIVEVTTDSRKILDDMIPRFNTARRKDFRAHSAIPAVRANSDSPTERDLVFYMEMYLNYMPAKIDELLEKLKEERKTQSV